MNSECRWTHFLLIAMVAIFSTACNPIQNSKYYEYLSQKYEVATCDTNYVYTATTSVSGVAQFFKRGINVVVENSKLKNMHLGDPLNAPLPIRHAEVAIYDWTNKLVQCGRTDEQGLLKAVDGVSTLTIPASAGTYSVRVFSRIVKTLTFAGKPDFAMNVSVKKDIYTNELYSIVGEIVSNGTDDSSVSLTAYARQSDSTEIEGGAFNILNTLYTTYDFVRTNTSTTNTTCLNGKLNVYWKAGFNPFQYYYPSSDPATLSSNSYYDQTNYSLYITGGKLGNVSLERTDHFGDYVIIHEFAHHVENVCGSLLTPGGSHYIVSRQDPRLMWAEGWANYFSAKVINSNIDSLDPEFKVKAMNAGLTNTSWTYFFGSEGFSDSVQNIGNGTGFMFDLKKEGKNPDTWQNGSLSGLPFDQVDPSRYPGEGHFREGAITRGLFKLSTACGTDGYCIDRDSLTPISFSDMWNAMNAITGIGASSFAFKSSAAFLEKLKSIMVSAGPWVAGGYKTFNEKTTSEALHIISDGAFASASGTSTVHRWPSYATTLSVLTSGECAVGRFLIQPRADDPFLTSVNSDQRYSNHFYTLDFNTIPAVDELNVKFIKQPGDGTTMQFDILLFTQNYLFNGDYECSQTDSAGNCKAYKPTRTTNSYVVKSDRRTGPLDTKTIRGLASLPRNQKYLLNIRAYTATVPSISPTTEYEYIIETQTPGVRLCP